MKTTKTLVDVSTDRTICSNVGTLLIADTANSLGIADVLDEHLAGLTPDTITHTAGTVMTSMAVALTAGATCLDDLNLLNPLVNTGLTRTTGSVTTAHRRVHQLADRVDVVDDKMTRAMRTIRTRAWNALGTLNPTTCATKADRSRRGPGHGGHQGHHPAHGSLTSGPPPSCAPEPCTQYAA